MKYDFIVVGSGPAGATVASRLAKSAKAPQVLLLEAGGTNQEVDSRVLADRFTTFFTHPHYNWGYMTAPQKHLLDRELPYPRGKGLGGSSAINFAFYTRGASEDFNEWARQVGDEYFNWENAERRFKKFEGFDLVRNPKHLKYVNPKPEDHGIDGPVKIEIPYEWERTFDDVLESAYDIGMEPNLDLNSGNPIGIGVCPATGDKSYRSTSATAFLDDAPSNLTIVTGAPTTKILFDGNRAAGVMAAGKEYYAEKEVILSAGALDTPKLLLLSGVGPKEELARHKIDVLADLPVGKNLQDHAHFGMNMQLKDGTNDRAAWMEPTAMKAAREQFAKDGTGPISMLYTTAVVGFFNGSKELLASEEFTSLSSSEQEYIKHPSVPTWEVATMCPPLTPLADPTKTYLTVVCFGMVPQSRGSVTLKSADPADPPVCNPNFFDHPFDRKNVIDAARRGYALLTSPGVANDIVEPFVAPKSMSDEDIWQFIQEQTNSTYHMSCTAKMGKPDDETAVLTTDFKVKGLKGLRIADMSVTPFIPNCHTVSTAYMIGESAAEKFIEEYGLDA